MGSALEFHSGTNKIQWDGSKIAHLFPGEKLNMLKAEQPVAAFESFESASLRNLAASWNMSYEQLSRDYSKTNYSSARAAMLESWKFIIGERHRVGGRYANEQYSLFLEDAIDSGRVQLPPGAPGFYAPGAKRAYTRADWIGPGREHIDPERGEKATRLALSNATTTLEKECAARGLDWREVLEQRRREQDAIKKAGLSFPEVFPESEETTDPDPENDETDETDGPEE
jgi:lambda family phage portal protein